MVSKIDEIYKNLLLTILGDGYNYEDPKRKNVKRREILDFKIKYDFKDGFPILSSKKINYDAVVYELLWFLKGDTNIKYLVDRGVNIWNKDAYNWYIKQVPKENGHWTYKEYLEVIKSNDKTSKLYHELGDLGRIYGAQWRWFLGSDGSGYTTQGVDQIANLIENLKKQPLATDHIVTAWNPSEIEGMALPPCHRSFQVLVRPLSPTEMVNTAKEEDKRVESFSVDEKLSDVQKDFKRYGFYLQWDQRSVDVFLGLPFNIASYATLARIIEEITGYKALGIIGNLSKVHIYHNHLKQVREQLNRSIQIPSIVELNLLQNKSLWKKDINKIIDSLYKGSSKDFKLKNYEPKPFIRANMLERNE